ncbi:MAG: T9SS type A sorting domain-containing protein [Paramuribaculum sp.]|nr:T9SS type A sorting domain-containing protein [Paramuribaculum sp.]MDE6324364.1 T9SS type A sorting domain-containing protein [Paramuribaculum sp.]MDE6487670.1 T9SS type A sorting domain-containing protein [Paramuribaculum sp.]
MYKKALRRVFTVAVLLLTALSSVAAVRSWESVDRIPSSTSDQIAQADEFTAVVREGCLYLELRQRSTVRLFTILGQPVVQETLGAGVYRLRLGGRGIYLLKINSTTRRITL